MAIIGSHYSQRVNVYQSLQQRKKDDSNSSRRTSQWVFMDVIMCFGLNILLDWIVWVFGSGTVLFLLRCYYVDRAELVFKCSVCGLTEAFIVRAHKNISFPTMCCMSVHF